EGGYLSELRQRIAAASPSNLYRVEMAPKELPSKRKPVRDPDPRFTRALRAALSHDANDATFLALLTPQYQEFLGPRNSGYWDGTPGSADWRREHFRDV